MWAQRGLLKLRGFAGKVAAPRHFEQKRAMSLSHFATPFLTPSARHLVESLGLDAANIVGSGKGNRVLKGDVLAFIKAGAPAAAPAATTTAPAADAVPVAAAAATTAAAVADAAPRGPYTDVVPTAMRRIIASRLTESKATVPHYYTVMEIRLDALLAARKQLKAMGIVFSVNDVIVKACSLALRDVPAANARFDVASNKVIENDSVDVCVAVATPGGLITPIVPNSDQLGLSAIHTKVVDLATRARKGSLLPEEFQGGSFTISNLGMFGIDEFTAVINPPQSAILAVGGGTPKLIFEEDAGPEDAPVTATMMSVQLSADRRVLDEATSAQFLQVLRQYLQNPMTCITA